MHTIHRRRTMFGEVKDRKGLIAELNKALGWELRAEAMYAHYAAYLLAWTECA